MLLNKKFEKYNKCLLGFAYDYTSLSNDNGILSIYLVVYLKNNIQFIKYKNVKSSILNIYETIKMFSATPLNYWFDENLYQPNGIVRKKIDNFKNKDI